MAHKTQVLKCKCQVNAPPAEVFRAFSSATALREWFCDAAQVEARKGGRIYAWWNSGYYAAGQFYVVNPDKKLAFTWRGRGEPESTQVQVSFTPKKGGTAVAVTHSGIWSGRAWAEAVAEFEQGWRHALDNLKSVLETGQDPRFVNRPMLGINVGDFNAAAAARLGAPVSEGALVDGVVDGMGARAAGLRSGDVIVNLGGNKVTGWNSLAPALQKFSAGDRVPVAFYRDGEKQTVTMELSRRPLPEAPAEPARMAEALRRFQADVNADLDKSFEGVSDAEASRRPAEGEWSAKEHLAHLITGERFNQDWIAGLITGKESDSTPDNVTEVYAAIAGVNDVADMVSEFKRNQAETAAIVAALPPEFAARKGSYWRVGYNLLQEPTHTFDHLAQARAAIRAARGKSVSG